MEFHSIAFHGTHFTQRQGEMSKINFIQNKKEMSKLIWPNVVPKQLRVSPTALYFFIFMNFAF